MAEFAPIVIFAYRRPDHLRHTLFNLMRCEGFEQSPIIVYCDGPRGPEDAEQVEATRSVAQEMLGKRAEFHFSENNKGLAASVIAGVSDVVGRFGRVIVVEDDLELNPEFLSFLNQALIRYQGEESVMQVSGYLHGVARLPQRSTAFFLPVTVSWGWATWSRAWRHFDASAVGWEELESDTQLRRAFNMENAYDYSAMLKRQMSGGCDSWAIRWYWTVFKKKGLVLFPPVSLVRSTGLDGSGAHGSGRFRAFGEQGMVTDVHDIQLPSVLGVDDDAYTCVKSGLRKMNGGWFGRMMDILKSYGKHGVNHAI